MNPKTENLITVMDAGSSKICVLVAELNDGVLRYRGHGIEAARGMRRGVISNLGPAGDSINKAAMEAEKKAKAPIETTVVGGEETGGGSGRTTAFTEWEAGGTKGVRTFAG